jgi:hypothetical protein
MKTNTFIFAIVFFVSTIFSNAALIVTSDIGQAEFNGEFSSFVWYAQLQPGGPGTADPDNEFELGTNGTLFHYQGNTSITDEANNPFSIEVSPGGFLSVEFNGIGTPGGNQPAVTQAFNTIWVGVELTQSSGFTDSLDVNNQIFNGASLSNVSITNDPTPGWMAFKFYDDAQLTNISSVSLVGDILPDMFFTGSFQEDWTYTVFATHDSNIIPEPSTYALMFGGLAIVLAVARRRS